MGVRYFVLSHHITGQFWHAVDLVPNLDLSIFDGIVAAGGACIHLRRIDRLISAFYAEFFLACAENNEHNIRIICGV